METIYTCILWIAISLRAITMQCLIDEHVLAEQQELYVPFPVELR